MKTLYLCETGAEAEYAAQQPAAIRMPLTVHAWWAFERAGVEFVSPEATYDEWAFAELREPALDLELGWIGWLDRELREAIPALGSLGLDVATPWLYCFKRLIDQFIGLEFIVTRVLQATAPSEVVSSGAVPQPSWELFFRRGAHGGMVVPTFSPAAIARLVCERQGIAWREGPAPPATAAPPPRLHFARRLVRQIPAHWRDDVDLVRGQSIRRGAALLLKRLLPGRDRVLVVRGGYDLDILVRRAMTAGCRVEYWTRASRRTRLSVDDTRTVEAIRKDARLVWPSLAASQRFRAPFAINGLDLFSLVEPGLRHFVTSVVPGTAEDFLTASRCLRERRYRAVLAPAGIREATLLHAARRAKVPVVIYQHGGYVGTCEQLFWDLTDLGNADHLFVYGEGVREYFAGRPVVPGFRRAEMHVTGSARLEEIAGDFSARAAAPRVRRAYGAGAALKVLYVPTKTSGYARPLVADSYPEVGYHMLQHRVLAMMRDFPNASFVYKPFADSDDRLVREIASSLAVTNCRIERETKLPALMEDADIIVMDFPSTGLLEAALTDKVLIVYADRRSLRLQPAAAALLRRRAAVTETEDDFLGALRAALGGRVAGDVNDDAYARAFALDPAGGSPTQRAWSTLAEIMRKGARPGAQPSLDCGNGPDTWR